MLDRDGDLALMRAERDALKATVDRVSQSVNIHRDCLYCHGPECCTHAREVADALAGGECGLCHAEPHNYGATAHGFGKCVERRKATMTSADSKAYRISSSASGGSIWSTNRRKAGA